MRVCTRAMFVFFLMNVVYFRCVFLFFRIKWNKKHQKQEIFIVKISCILVQEFFHQQNEKMDDQLFVNYMVQKIQLNIRLYFLVSLLKQIEENRIQVQLYPDDDRCRICNHRLILPKTKK